MSTAKPMTTERRIAGYVNQRKPGYISDTHVVTARQWLRVIHKERRRADFNPDLPYVYKEWGGKENPTPRQRRPSRA